MKKFKIKNRQKRKYVKKNALTNYYSSAQSLTVGIIPLVLIVIAFFATSIMYNPALSTLSFPVFRLIIPAIPQVVLPEIKMEFALPSLPKVSLPTPQYKFSVPEAPKISLNFLENIKQQIVGVLIATTVMINAADQTLLQTESTVINTFNTTGQIIAVAAQTMWANSVAITLNIGSAIINLFINTFFAISRVVIFIQELVIDGIISVVTIIQSLAKAIVNAVNAFIWIIGTPFRALAHSFAMLGMITAPYFNYLVIALNRASNDLAVGGDHLVQGTIYVTNTVEHNSTQK